MGLESRSRAAFHEAGSTIDSLLLSRYERNRSLRPTLSACNVPVRSGALALTLRSASRAALRTVAETSSLKDLLFFAGEHKRSATSSADQIDVPEFHTHAPRT